MMSLIFQKLLMMHQQLLEGIWAEAWREQTETSFRGSTLRTIRSAKSRERWERVSEVDRRLREKEDPGSRRSRQGPICMWEDPTVAYLGTGWRRKLKICPNKWEWIHWFRKMAGPVAGKWHLS